MTFTKVFNEHPRSVGESYGEHLVTATRFGSRMVVAGCACMLHGIFPFLCVTTGSTTVRHLHERMITHRSRKAAAPEIVDLGAYI